MVRAENQEGQHATPPGEQRAMERHAAARAYALLLRLYPPAHRRAFGQQMLQTFQDHYRDRVETQEESARRYWQDVLGDVGRSLVREYWLTVRLAISERAGAMKAAHSVVLVGIIGTLLLLGLRVWLSPALLWAPHGGVPALSSVVGLALLVLIYGVVAVGLLRAHMALAGPRRAVSVTALRRATLVGVLLGGGALVAIAVATLGSIDSPVSLAVWGLVVVAAPVGWGLVGVLTARVGGSWRLGLVAGLWSGMVSALVGAIGEVASTLLALPRLVQLELSNPDYLAWHQPDVQSYAIASAFAVGMVGLILAPVVAALAGSIGSGISTSRRTVRAALSDEATLR